MVLALSCPGQQLPVLSDLAHAGTSLTPSVVVSGPLSCLDFHLQLPPFIEPLPQVHPRRRTKHCIYAIPFTLPASSLDIISPIPLTGRLRLREVKGRAEEPQIKKSRAQVRQKAGALTPALVTSVGSTLNLSRRAPSPAYTHDWPHSN